MWNFIRIYEYLIRALIPKKKRKKKKKNSCLEILETGNQKMTLDPIRQFFLPLSFNSIYCPEKY